MYSWNDYRCRWAQVNDDDYSYSPMTFQTETLTIDDDLLNAMQTKPIATMATSNIDNFPPQTATPSHFDICGAMQSSM